MNLCMHVYKRGRKGERERDRGKREREVCRLKISEGVLKMELRAGFKTKKRATINSEMLRRQPGSDSTQHEKVLKLLVFGGMTVVSNCT